MLQAKYFIQIATVTIRQITTENRRTLYNFNILFLQCYFKNCLTNNNYLVSNLLCLSLVPLMNIMLSLWFPC